LVLPPTARMTRARTRDPRPKSVSRIRLAENNLDGVGRRLRAPGSQQANAEELLAELVRLVESSTLAPERSSPPAQTVSESTRTGTEPMRRLEIRSLRPSVEAQSSNPSETRVDVEPPRASQSDNSYSNHPNGINLATGRRAGAWKFRVSALVLVGAAVLGSIFWLKRVEPGLPNAPPFIATAQGPATQPQSNSTVAASSEAGATPKDVTQPAQGKIASPEDRPLDLNARVSLNNPPQPDLAPTVIGAAQPTADASAGKPLAASVNTSAVAAPIAAPQAMTSQSLDAKPAPAVSLPPASTQIATPTPSTAGSGAAAPSTDAPLPPVRPALKPAIEAAGAARRPTSKLDLPTKLSNKSDARVVVAKADATGAKAPAERSAPPQREASVKPEKGATTLNAAQAPTGAPAAAAPSQQPIAAQQPSPNPVVRTFKNMVGALTGLIPFVPH
jgi:hypothetical protein